MRTCNLEEQLQTAYLQIDFLRAAVRDYKRQAQEYMQRIDVVKQILDRDVIIK